MRFHFVGDTYVGVGLGGEGRVWRHWEDEGRAQREIDGRKWRNPSLTLRNQFKLQYGLP